MFVRLAKSVVPRGGAHDALLGEAASGANSNVVVVDRAVVFILAPRGGAKTSLSSRHNPQGSLVEIKDLST